MKARHYPSLLLLILMAPSLFAQSEPAAINVGQQDSTLAAPHLWGRSGTQESQALDILRKSIQATGNAGWVGFQARGLIYYGSDSGATYPATLTVRDDGRLRLDVEKPEGLISSRFSGLSGGLRIADHPVMRVDARDAIRSLLVFPLALMASDNLSTLAVRSAGQVTIGTTVLDTVALSRPLPPHVRSKDLNAPMVVTDLYFDSQTGLLSKSVDMEPQLGGFPELLKRVVTYSDYEKSNGISIPMKYDATLAGQPAWSLNITSVQPLPASIDASYFEF